MPEFAVYLFDYLPVGQGMGLYESQLSFEGQPYLDVASVCEFEQVSDILMAMVEKKYDVEYFEPEQ